MKAEILIEHGLHDKGSVHEYIGQHDNEGAIGVKIEGLYICGYYLYLKGQYRLIEEPKKKII
jgi:hypothetical protein